MRTTLAQRISSVTTDESVSRKALELLRDENGNHRAAWLNALALRDDKMYSRDKVYRAHFEAVVSWMEREWKPELEWSAS